ncbi:MAG: dolichyl-phosphate mannose synthase [Cellulosilyticum sp.]|nr:dolichyl-phosphate mannose synthase [Cellulosilyticum sp.]
MSKIHLVMPMGGGGTRFGNKGFNLPKPLIELQGKPFFYWATQSIVKYIDVEDIIFVVLQDHIDRFNIDTRIKECYPDAKIQVIPEVLNGAVLTCCEGMKQIDDDLPILFNDCDHAFICNSFVEFCKKADFNEIDGALLTFKSNSPNYSYVKFNDSKKVIGTIEKVVVSDEAICGAYYFRNKDIFNNAVDSYLKECEYKEFFVSGVYNEMAKLGESIITFGIDEHISFGTPDEYDLAINDSRLKELE